MPSPIGETFAIEGGKALAPPLTDRPSSDKAFRQLRSNALRITGDRVGMKREPSAWTTAVALIMGAGMLAGCGASLPSLTTGSLFGGSAASTAAPAAPQIQNDPISRALQVGATAAKAQKCGFNFAATKLRTQFLANESAALPNAADVAKINQSYDASYRGTAKAIAGEGEDYCSTQKTQVIKTALTRHLAGDYTPTPPEPVEEDDGGLFGSFGDSSTNAANEQKLRHPPVGDY